jgi:hypothetical protein
MKNLLRLIRTIMLTHVLIPPQASHPTLPSWLKDFNGPVGIGISNPGEGEFILRRTDRTSKMLTGSVLIALRPKVPRNWVYRVCRMFDEGLGSKVMFNV